MSIADTDHIQRKHPRTDARREPPHAIKQPGASIGSSRDASWRRGIFEGASLALRLAADGWTEAELADWLERLADWRFDADAGELPPMPKGGRE